MQIACPHCHRVYDETDVESPPARRVATYDIGAWTCLLLAIAGFLAGPLAQIPAMVTGHRSLRRIRNADDPLQGGDIAKIGLLMAYLGLIAWLYTFAPDLKEAGMWLLSRV